MFDALENASVEDLEEIREQHAIQFFNPRLRDIFGGFVQQYVRASMNGERKAFLPRWLSVRYHFQTTFPDDQYDGQSKVERVRVYFEQHFYDGDEIHDLGRTEIMLVPITPR